MDSPWFWLIVALLLLFFVGCIWLLTKIVSHAIGANTELKGKIHYPPWFVAAVIFGLFGLLIPVVNILLVFAFAAYIKPRSVLNRARDALVANMTPEDVVASVEQQVRANPATPLSSGQVASQWVQEVWASTSHEAWVQRLHAHEPLFRQALQARLKVGAGSLEPHANWIELMQYFIYLENSTTSRPISA